MKLTHHLHLVQYNEWCHTATELPSWRRPEKLYLYLYVNTYVTYIHIHASVPTYMRWMHMYIHIKHILVQKWTGLVDFHEVEGPRILDNRYIKAVGTSVLNSGRLYSQKACLILISVRT